MRNVVAVALSILLLPPVLVAAEQLLRVAVTRRSAEPECAGARSGDRLAIEYEARRGGTVFDATLDAQPFEFTLGTGQVIKGLDQGLLGICAGEARKIVVRRGVLGGG